jgi:predicted permease
MASVRPIDSEGYLVGSVGVVDGQPLTGDRRIRYAFNVLGSGYFSALQIPLLAGRDFGPQDQAGAPHVAIINESMARRLFGDANPLGRHFGQNTREMVEVVGVVRDTKYGNLVDAPRPVLYLPIGQTPWASQTTFLLRYTGAGETLTNVVRQRLSAVDPHLPMFRINTLDLEARESVLRQRLLALVSTSFGLVALLLAAVGLYGLMSFAVAQRSKEIGVRMALGADRKRVVRMTLAESLSLIALGILIGVPSGVVMTYAARSLLFGLTPGDPLSVVLVVATMTAVVLVAGYIPARRAAGVDPMVALRVD